MARTATQPQHRNTHDKGSEFERLMAEMREIIDQAKKDMATGMISPAMVKDLSQYLHRAARMEKDAVQIREKKWNIALCKEFVAFFIQVFKEMVDDGVITRDQGKEVTNKLENRCGITLDEIRDYLPAQTGGGPGRGSGNTRTPKNGDGFVLPGNQSLQ